MIVKYLIHKVSVTGTRRLAGWFLVVIASESWRVNYGVVSIISTTVNVHFRAAGRPGRRWLIRAWVNTTGSEQESGCNLEKHTRHLSVVD